MRASLGKRFVGHPQALTTTEAPPNVVADGETNRNRKNQRRVCRAVDNFLVPDHLGHVDVDVDLARNWTFQVAAPAMRRFFRGAIFL
jgi:hypothetical protein